MEFLDRVHFLAKADEFDRLAGDGAHRKRRTAAPVAVHTGQDHAGDADLPVELLGHIDRVLSGKTVNHQQRLARACGVADGLHLFHQLFVDVQTTGGIEQIDIIATQRRLLFGPFGDLHGALAFDDRQGIDTDLRAQYLQLLHGGGAIDIERGHQNPLVLLFLQPFRQFRGGGGFTRALQADHQDRRGRVVHFQLAGIGVVTGQNLDQLVMHNLDDLLARCHRLGNRLSGCLFLHRLDEITRHRQRDIGLQQGHTHLAHRCRDVGIRKRTLFGELVKNAGEPVGQILEHIIAPLGQTSNHNGPRGRNALTGGDPDIVTGPEVLNLPEVGGAIGDSRRRVKPQRILPSSIISSASS